jgi:hypothetical protein
VPSTDAYRGHRAASELSPDTLLLRPRGLDPDRAALARALKQEDPQGPLQKIARQLGPDVTEEDARLALATLRCRNPRPTRATVAAPFAAVAFLEAEAKPGELRWRRLGRLLDELRERRALSAGPRFR